jgi:hypothetical protein
VGDVRGIAMVGNKSGKRISNCTPTIGQCQQHHAAIRGKSAIIEGSCDFLARNGWQVEVESISVTSPTAPGVIHRWTNMTDFTQEIANARIWAGFH